MTALLELSDEGGLGPTSVFKKIYGNYCGPGNRGGAPIDGLDCACQQHDQCYYHLGRDTPGCDARLVAGVDTFLKNGKLTFKQRMYGNLIKSHFTKKQQAADKRTK